MLIDRKNSSWRNPRLGLFYTAALLLMLAIHNGVQSDELGQNSLAELTPKENEMTQMVGLYITFWAAPGKLEELIDAVKEVLLTVQQEEGTLVYGFHKVVGEREGLSVYEVYKNAEAQRLHGESQSINILLGRLESLLSGPPESYYIIPVSGAKGLPF